MIHDATRTIIARNKSPDISFDQSINPIGAASMAASTASPAPPTPISACRRALDFESRLFAKPNAAALLAEELSAPGYVPSVIAMGTNTDPYSAAGKEDAHHAPASWRCCATSSHPVAIVTKSPLILRDLDILSDMAASAAWPRRRCRSPPWTASWRG